MKIYVRHKFNRKILRICFICFLRNEKTNSLKDLSLYEVRLDGQSSLSVSDKLFIGIFED